MAKGKKLQSNFTRGELSPRLMGRPDLAAYFNGVATLENYYIYPQGGVYRPPGTRFVKEVKTSANKTRLVPFVFSRTQSYWLEFGDLYIRFYRNGAVLGAPFEVVTPYLTADLFDLHFTQSADVLFIDHGSYAPRKLSRVSDTNWTLSTLGLRVGPSYERDTDISGGTVTLTPGATTGTGVTFTASANVFQDADVDRQIIFGAARATIITVTVAGGSCTADILDDFPNTNPIAAGSWLLRGSPQASADPNKKEPLGGKVTVVASAPGETFRSADIGKILKLSGGAIELNDFDSSSQMKGIIRSLLKVDTIVSKGLWTLETAAWSAALGYPKSLAFYQGRLGHCGNAALSTTWWLSRPDDYENYATGELADCGLDYTVISRQVNSLVWMADLGPLILASNAAIFAARGPGVDQPLGGDIVPSVKAQDGPGSASIQPLVVGNKALYIDASTLKIIEIGFDYNMNEFRGDDLTRASEHIAGTGFAKHPPAWAESPNRHAFFIRANGQLAVMTYYPVPEQVIGWSRRTTDGDFESIIVIPHPDGDRDQVACIVKRTINGATKRYIEVFEDKATEFSARAWQELHTDCAIVYDGAAVTNVAATFAAHLEAKTVDVVADGSYRGTRVISNGQFTVALQEAASKIEIGLDYDSTLKTVPAAMQDAIIDPQLKMWDRLTVRFLKSRGCNVNGRDMTWPVGGEAMDTSVVFTGKKSLDNYGWSEEGQITLKQTQPYPQAILSLSGWLNVGDR